MKISELAKRCEYEFSGEDREVDSILYSHCAKESSIAIINNISEVDKTKAKCILSKPVFINTDKTILYMMDSIEVAVVKVAKVLMDTNEIKIYSLPNYTKVVDYDCGKNIKIGKDTITSPNVYIGDDVQIGNSCFIEPNVNIGSGTIIKDNVYISSFSSIGTKSFYHYYEEGLQEFSGVGKVIIDSNVSIGNHTTIQRGTFSDTFIGNGCKIGNLIDIGHDVQIGCECKIVSESGIASNVNVGNHVQIFGQVGIANHVQIGDFVTIMAKSLVAKNIHSGKTVSGMYAREHLEELRFQAKLRSL